MTNDYQYDYATLHSQIMYDQQGRERKAKTMVAIAQEYFADKELSTLQVLDVGASTGFIDNYLASYFDTVVGIDIDSDAIAFAEKQFQNINNLKFQLGDAMQLDFADNSFDFVLCTHIYEHIPDPEKMMTEIHRVLRKNGVCYFTAGNRLAIQEPHYKLPFLSIMPKFLAHLYLRLLGRGKFYYETHLTYWGLKKLVKSFETVDYTKLILDKPEYYQATYMLPSGSMKQRIAQSFARFAYPLFPGYIWLLRKV